MKPKPLDLDVDEEISEELNKLQPHDLQTQIDIFKKVIEQRIKSACEFYLRYKDNPELLVKEHPEFEEKIEKIKWIPNPDFEACKEGWFEQVYGKNINCKNCPVKKSCLEDGEFIENVDFLKDYNEWLFKLAFKEVLK